jgi:DNA-binding CsgD family transcriptional regulator
MDRSIQMAGAKTLIERETALETIRALGRAATGGRGRALCVLGDAGVGKSSLLSAARAQIESGRLRVLWARGAELEQQFAMGVARQLFDGPVRRLSADQRRSVFAGAARLAAPVLGLAPEPSATSGLADRQAAMYGLLWLTSNFAEEAPLVLSVDDGHWADSSSIEWLRFLVRRLDELPVAVLVAGRPNEWSTDWMQIAGEPNVDVLELAPLSTAGVACLLREQLQHPPEQHFLEECHRLTGGNPLLLSEVITTIAGERLAGADSEIERLSRLAPQRLTRTVATRINAMPEEAAMLARAAAILGSDITLGPAAALAGLSESGAARAADELIEARLFQPAPSFGFVHPLVRHALYDSIPIGQRGFLHGAAARLLDDRGEDAERVAAHLLHTTPGNAAWVVPPLRRAAHLARTRASPTSAIAYLNRALAESLPKPARFNLLADLGIEEAAAQRPEAAAHLEDARILAPDSHSFASTAIAEARVLVFTGKPDRAVPILRDAVGRLGDTDHDTALLLFAEMLSCARTAGDRRAAMEAVAMIPADIAGSSHAERVALAALAADAGWRGQPADSVIDLARRALAEDRLLHERATPSYSLACAALTWCDALTEACSHYSSALNDARSRGNAMDAAISHAWRAETRLRQGAIPGAEEDAEAALGLTSRSDTMSTPFALGWLVGALVERDRSDEAHRLVTGVAQLRGPPVFNIPLLVCRAQLRLVQGRPADALRDALQAGDSLIALGAPSPAMVPWRSLAAAGFLGLGERAQASELVTEELRLATAVGAPRPLGVALRISARLADGLDDRISVLRDSVATLEASEAQLDHAWSLVELGVAIRRSGRPKAARPPLARALDIAVSIGAARAARWAREELAASGGKPRRDRVTGRDALTASERRVADLAVAGLTNREIAQQLFLSAKTVETHLGHTYQKLGTPGRAGLRDALQGTAV